MSATVQTSEHGLAAFLLTAVLALCAGCSDSSEDYVEFDELPGSRNMTVSEDPASGMKLMSVQLPPGPGMPGVDLEEGMQTDLDPAEAADPAAGPSTAADLTAEAVEKSGTNPVPGGDTASGDTASGDTAEGARSVRSEQSGLIGPADRPQIDQGDRTSAADPERAIELLIPSKRFLKERGTEAMRVTYDDIDLLKILNMEPVPPDAPTYFPDWLAALDGSVVRIRGYMYPTFLATGLTEFAMARDNGICCFVRQPKIYDIISVSLDEGETTDYIANRPFDVEGVFRIDPESDDTSLTRLYRIERARVLQ